MEITHDKMKPKKKRDMDMINAEAALIRAARRARERAWSAGIGVVYLKDGRIVEEMSDGTIKYCQ
ncbi:hypothetical protein Dthio_PD0405 [Desulfonatronospira thiodismutans ASO3-1]|uniref:Uncharacterized protein n=1 Tax=Desulfonatronospira thiodismutans ASO3-1 TaxID=555779 RepID=D6SUW0_9BACT|nr:hypothetical protein [Desulfonatronospira thiodismutans]EFI33090.1 hypothetical protein Dthio_PD0405 [Desulfonatronospira thiodismutans ASO3-1]